MFRTPEKRGKMLFYIFCKKKFLRHVSTYVQPILDSHHHRINRFFLDIRRIIGFIYLQFVERYQAIRKSKDVQVECLKKQCSSLSARQKNAFRHDLCVKVATFKVQPDALLQNIALRQGLCGVPFRAKVQTRDV